MTLLKTPHGDRLLVALCATSLLAGCGTIDRSPDLSLGALAQPLFATEDPRLSPDRFGLARSCPDDRCASGRPPVMLALSGGGATGAYGAGVLAGWSERGDRPEFDIVTGVSTGALSAPFAFLGPEWDDEMANAYLNARTEGIVGWRAFAAFALPGVFSPKTLEALVDENVTPELLRSIGREHERGRRLYVGTTNLDRGDTVIWDMGLIAVQGDENALALFRQVLLASASIPGVFPPVLIAALDDDNVVRQQMHVDGAVSAGFIGVPSAIMLDRQAASRWRGAQIYVIVNGKAALDRVRTPGRLRDVVERTIEVTGNAALMTRLDNQAVFARQTGAALRIAAIPPDVEASSLRFDREEMNRLLTMGRETARSGAAFRSLDAAASDAGVDDGGPIVEVPPAPG